MFQRSGILQDWVELKVWPKGAESSLVFRKRDIFMLLFRESLETALKIIEITALKINSFKDNIKDNKI